MQRYIIFIGVDISKKWIDVALLITAVLQTSLPHQRFDQTKEGYQSFLAWVQECICANCPDQRESQLDLSKILVCMEHTGIYTLNFCHFLQASSIDFVVENPMQIKRRSGIRRGKNDKADAIAIARYAYRYQDQLNKCRALPNSLLIKVQMLLSLRNRLVKYKQGLLCASNELKTCVSSHLVEHSIECSELISNQINQQTKELIKEVKKLIFSDIDLKKQYLLLTSIVGIGEVIAAYLLVYTNGFSAFNNPRHFASYIGVAPFKSQSGISLDLPPKVSKTANRHLNKLMSTACIVAIQHDPQIKAYFIRNLERGKKNGWIYNAIKNKIVHRIFAVIKRETPYVKLQF